MKIKGSLMVIVGLLAMVLLLESNPVHGGKVRGVTNDTIKFRTPDPDIAYAVWELWPNVL